MTQRPHLNPGQLTLDLVPRPPADTTERFIDYLRSEPGAGEVAQELVLGYLADFQARACLISVIEPDATLRLAGGFGLDGTTQRKLGECSLWDDLPTALAIRERRGLMIGERADVQRLFPVLADLGHQQHAVIAVPLMTSASTVGSVCVCLDADGNQVRLASQVLSAIADVYVLYLLANTERRAHAAPASWLADRAFEVQSGIPVHRAPLSVKDFTERQKTVLQLLAQGMTYDQIAMRIGYSHSTVRMELMTMYRAFDVSSRRQAVAAATRHGLLSDDC